MAYVKTNWVDDVTPLSATNMNNIEDAVAENSVLSSQNTNVSAYQSLEITKLRMELVLTQLNSVGFYDLFDTTDDVNLALTDATVDTGTQDVIFIGDKNLVMNEQQFAVTADNALIKLYTDDTTFNYATVESDVTDASAVTVAENLAIGDKLWTDSENAITDVVDSTVGFDIANGSYDSISFSIASQELNPSSIAFNNDGTKLFMIGRVGNTIYQYSLPTPFVLTGMSYDSVSFSVSSQDTSSRSIAFNNDGTKLFLLGDTNDKIYQYSLPTPFVLTGMSYDNISFSVSSQDTSSRSIAFNNDGTKLFLLGDINDTIYQYSLPTPFVLTGMSYDSVSFSINSQDTSPYSITFNDDGSKLFMVGWQNDKIYQYSLPTPFVLTGMSYDNISFSVSSQDTSPSSITFNNDGTKLFMIGVINDTIYQYSTGEASFNLTLTSPITALADDQILILDYQAYVNDTLCTLLDVDGSELTFELANINSDTIILKVNGKDGVVLDDLLVAIS